MKIQKINNNLIKQNKPSFKAGVQTSYGISYIPKKNVVENGFFEGFLGILKTSNSLFDAKAQQRANSIKEGMEQTSLDFTA
ncbi:hypothetical protein IKA15_04125 [bacterium]|nr:hypothetical protein [bacterium]